MESIQPIKQGDTVGIIAPSDPILEEHKEKFDKGINYLKGLGLNIKFSRNLFSNSQGYSATPKEKAEDIIEMFLNSSVKLIICAQGGENSNTVLPYLDFEAIKNNPKPFIGISDITCLLNGIYKKTGLITYHGNDIIWGFGRSPTSYDINEFKEKIIEGNFEKLNKNSNWKIIKQGVAEGLLLGGNITCLLNLAGTEYFPDFTNSILFIEAFKPSSTRFESMISHLKQLGVFDKINGLIIGHIDGLNDKVSNIVIENLKEYDFPIIKIEEFGHNTPNTVIPLGMMANLNTKKLEINYTK